MKIAEPNDGNPPVSSQIGETFLLELKKRFKDTSIRTWLNDGWTQKQRRENTAVLSKQRR